MIGTDLFIDNESSLAELISSIVIEPIISLDTEFMRESTYYPKLCLIQIATPKLAACIDCLADMDLSPLFELLLEKNRGWILHSARQDLEVIHQHANGLPTLLIDTQIAAALLGRPPQIGLQDITQELLNIKLDKSLSRTNWTKRPLATAAIEYALDDVHHLLRLWDSLRSELEKRDRMSWFEEDCQQALGAPLVTPPLTLWERLRGLGSLEAQSQFAALSLVEWREQCAQKLDRPRRWILSDELLMRTASKLPTTHDELASIAEMPPQFIKRFGDEILATTTDHEYADKMTLIKKRINKPRPDKNNLKQLQDHTTRRAHELGIQPEILATRKELTELLVGNCSNRISTGWRSRELGELFPKKPQNSNSISSDKT